MSHETSLLATISVGLVFAFVGGFIAVRLRLPPIVGYLVAGIAVGPFTPGLSDTQVAPQLAEIGVILLMFGVGMHFSVRDLWAVRGIAVPGAWPDRGGHRAGPGPGAGCGAGPVAPGCSSAWPSRWPARWCCCARWRSAAAARPRAIAVGWLIVEDLVMVLALVLLPALAPGGGGRRDRRAAGSLW